MVVDYINYQMLVMYFLVLTLFYSLTLLLLLLGSCNQVCFVDDYKLAHDEYKHESAHGQKC